MTPTRRALLGALAGGLATVAGCGYRPGGGERRWSRSIGRFDSVDAVMLAAGWLLATVRETRGFDFDAEEWRQGGELAVIDPVRGETIGGHFFEEPLVAAAHDGDTVYVALADGSVRAGPFEDDTQRPGAVPDGPPATPPGERAGGWAVTTDAAAAGAPTLVAGARVYVGGEGGVAALAPADGTTAWRWAGETARTVVPSRGDTAVAAYVMTDERLVALGTDGAVRWTRRTSSGTKPPVVDGKGIYLPDGKRLVALGHDGRERWSKTTGQSLGRPVLSDDRLYHVAEPGVVRSFALDGRERWRTEVPTRAVSGVAAGNGRAFLWYVDRLAGVGNEGVAWQIDLDSAGEFTPAFGPFAVDDVVVLAGERELRGYWQSQLPRDGGIL